MRPEDTSEEAWTRLEEGLRRMTPAERIARSAAVASSAYGEPRATNDVDVIALLDEASARELVRELGPAFYADGDMLHRQLACVAAST